MRVLILFVALFSLTAAAPTHPIKVERVTIKTSAICGMCKATIEKALYKLDGVETAVLDVTTKKVKVRYDAEKLDVNTLRQAISAAGYDADDIPARQRAYDALPGCCKKDGVCKKDEAASGH